MANRRQSTNRLSGPKYSRVNTLLPDLGSIGPKGLWAYYDPSSGELMTERAAAALASRALGFLVTQNNLRQVRADNDLNLRPKRKAKAASVEEPAVTVSDVDAALAGLQQQLTEKTAADAARDSRIRVLESRLDEQARVFRAGLQRLAKAEKPAVANEFGALFDNILGDLAKGGPKS
jgi:hypothetical protein